MRLKVERGDSIEDISNAMRIRITMIYNEHMSFTIHHLLNVFRTSKNKKNEEKTNKNKK